MICIFFLLNAKCVNIRKSTSQNSNFYIIRTKAHNFPCVINARNVGIVTKKKWTFESISYYIAKHRVCFPQTTKISLYIIFNTLAILILLSIHVARIADAAARSGLFQNYNVHCKTAQYRAEIIIIKRRGGSGWRKVHGVDDPGGVKCVKTRNARTRATTGAERN